MRAVCRALKFVISVPYDSEDLRDRPFLDRKAALARLLRDTDAGILFNEHIADDGPTLRARLSAWRGGNRLKEDRRHLSIRSLPGLIKVRNPASIAVQRKRSENWNK